MTVITKTVQRFSSSSPSRDKMSKSLFSYAARVLVIACWRTEEREALGYPPTHRGNWNLAADPVLEGGLPWFCSQHFFFARHSDTLPQRMCGENRKEYAAVGNVGNETKHTNKMLFFACLRGFADGGVLPLPPSWSRSAAAVIGTVHTQQTREGNPD